MICPSDIINNNICLSHTVYISIIVYCPRTGLALQTPYSSLHPLLDLLFRICIQFIYHDIVYHPIFYCYEPSFRLPFLQEHSSAGSFFLANGPANFFSSSLSVSALFFFLLLVLTQLHILFCLSILLYNHISNDSYRFCSFRRSIQVAAPYNATI